jgi:hypothetical protein
MIKTPHFEGFLVFIIMRELIRKILKEGSDLEKIKKNFRYNSEVLPGILEWIKEGFKGGVKVEVKEKMTHFGSDSYTGPVIELNLYVENQNLNPRQVKNEVWDGLNNFFNIDCTRYGSCIDINVFEKMWTKV